MASSIPGVWDYLYRNTTDPGRAFVDAYTSTKRTKQGDAELKQRADELARQTTLDKERTAERTAEVDRRKREREDELAGRYGRFTVRRPDGTVDVEGSAKASEMNQQRQKIAEALAERETLAGGSQETWQDPSLRMEPGYGIGQTKAQQAAAVQKALDERAKIAAQSRLEAAKIRGQQGGTSEGEPKIVVLEGVPGVMQGGKWTPLPENAMGVYQRNQRGAAGSPTDKPVPKLKRKPDGGWTLE